MAQQHLHKEEKSNIQRVMQNIFSSIVYSIQKTSLKMSYTLQQISFPINFNLPDFPKLLHYLVIPFAITLWLILLNQADITQMNDLGLVSILEPLSFIVLITLTTSYIVALQKEDFSIPLMAVHVVGLIVILYSVSPIMEEMPNFSVNWRHVGIIDYISNYGSIDPSIDAYFNWPAFFITSSAITKIAGITSPISFVPWSAVYFNLLYLLPLYQIFKLAFSSQRAVWFGIWLFYICNWIGQDYFSPQAINYFLYLVTIAILLTWFKKSGISVPNFGAENSVVSRLVNMFNELLTFPSQLAIQEQQQYGKRLAIFLILVVIFAASAISHQLTPFAILFAVTGLTFLSYISPRNLFIIMGIILATWISYMAVAYMQGNIDKILGEIGEMSSSLDENVTARIAGSIEHIIITKIRMGMSLLVWGLAFIGGLWRMYKKQHVVVWALLAGITFILLGLQDYGGEMILRVYLFSLPFMLIFVVSLFFPVSILQYKWATNFVLMALSSVIILGFLFGRYGNQLTDYKTVEEIDGVRILYDIAEPGSLLLAVRPNIAWKFEDYDTHKHRLVDKEFAQGDIDTIIGYMKHWEAPSYLVLTRSQEVSTGMFLNLTEDDWGRFENQLIQNGLSVIYSNDDTTIYSLKERALRRDIPTTQPELNIWETNYPPLLSTLILSFLLIAPGKALVWRLQLDDEVVEWMLAIALSISILILLSTALIMVNIWNTDLILFILVVITCVAIGFPSHETLKQFFTRFNQ